MQIPRHLVERKAVAGREREHDRIFGGRCLQLEVELAAEALAQRETPGAVDAAAEGRMNHELHATGFVEETLEDDRLLRRHRTERGARGGQILDELLRGGTSQPELLRQIGKRGSGVEPRYHIFAQS